MKKAIFLNIVLFFLHPQIPDFQIVLAKYCPILSYAFYV